MEDSRKRHDFVPADNSTPKRPRAEAEDAEYIDDNDDNDDDDDIVAWISVEEETVGELMTLLDDAEKSLPMAEKVKFIDDPYSSAMVFQSSSSYVTINGNEESCGSSFSESDSSMMASVDLNGGARIKLMEVDSETVEKWRLWKAEEAVSSDGLSWDEDDLARFIGEEEQFF